MTPSRVRKRINESKTKANSSDGDSHCLVGECCLLDSLFGVYSEVRMREIKFRAWMLEQKTMIRTFADGNDFVDGLFERSYPSEEKHILMQYTGLKDKNGVGIYEGDVLSRDGEVKFGDFEFLSGEDSYGKDIYRSGYGWYTECSDGECYSLLEEVHPQEEIIGNIHENPSLLDKK